MRIKYKILQDIRRDHITQNYASKDRLIDSAVYRELKSRKKCDHCHKPFSGQVPEIHHKKPISKGGNNTKDNLMAVHKKCHEELDALEDVGRHGSTI